MSVIDWSSKSVSFISITQHVITNRIVVILNSSTNWVVLHLLLLSETLMFSNALLLVSWWICSMVIIFALNLFSICFHLIWSNHDSSISLPAVLSFTFRWIWQMTKSRYWWSSCRLIYTHWVHVFEWLFSEMVCLLLTLQIWHSRTLHLVWVHCIVIAQLSLFLDTLTSKGLNLFSRLNSLLLIPGIEITLNCIFVCTWLICISCTAITLVVHFLIILLLSWLFVWVRSIHICVSASIVSHNTWLFTHIAEIVW